MSECGWMWVYEEWKFYYLTCWMIVCLTCGWMCLEFMVLSVDLMAIYFYSDGFKINHDRYKFIPMDLEWPWKILG